MVQKVTQTSVRKRYLKNLLLYGTCKIETPYAVLIECSFKLGLWKVSQTKVPYTFKLGLWKFSQTEVPGNRGALQL
jgi:hypothetical protein